MSERDPAPEPSTTPTRRRGRKLFAGFACAIGVVLITFEVRAVAENGSVGWFWLVVGALLLLMGLAEFLGPQE